MEVRRRVGLNTVSSSVFDTRTTGTIDDRITQSSLQHSLQQSLQPSLQPSLQQSQQLRETTSLFRNHLGSSFTGNLNVSGRDSYSYDYQETPSSFHDSYSFSKRPSLPNVVVVSVPDVVVPKPQVIPGLRYTANFDAVAPMSASVDSRLAQPMFSDVERPARVKIYTETFSNEPLTRTIPKPKSNNKNSNATTTLSKKKEKGLVVKGRKSGEKVGRVTRVFDLFEYDWIENYYKGTTPPNDFFWGQKKAGKSAVLDMFWLMIQPSMILPFCGSAGALATARNRVYPCYINEWGVNALGESIVKLPDNYAYNKLVKIYDVQKAIMKPFANKIFMKRSTL